MKKFALRGLMACGIVSPLLLPRPIRRGLRTPSRATRFSCRRDGGRQRTARRAGCT